MHKRTDWGKVTTREDTLDEHYVKKSVSSRTQRVRNFINLALAFHTEHKTELSAVRPKDHHQKIEIWSVSRVLLPALPNRKQLTPAKAGVF